MNTITFSQLVSISELQRGYPSLVKKMKRTGKPLFLLKRNKPEAVLLSIEMYQDLVDKKYFTKKIFKKTYLC